MLFTFLEENFYRPPHGIDFHSTFKVQVRVCGYDCAPLAFFWNAAFSSEFLSCRSFRFCRVRHAVKNQAQKYFCRHCRLEITFCNQVCMNVLREKKIFTSSSKRQPVFFKLVSFTMRRLGSLRRYWKSLISNHFSSLHAFEPHHRGDERSEEKYFPKRHWLFEHKD